MVGLVEQVRMVGGVVGGALAQAGHGAADAVHAAHAAGAIAPGSLGAVTGDLPKWALLIPFLPLLGCVLCGLCAALKVRNKLPAVITVLCLAGAFVAAVGAYTHTFHDGHSQTAVVKAWDWIRFTWGTSPRSGGGGVAEFVANFSFYVDSLTCLWMLFVTGLATLIALYASEYMAGDVKTAGYARFFTAFCLFVFSMACLVMGDNLLLLYLGWEGVGLCSYLLIGYFYTKPSAVAAAKKAFIMNRIGDLGLALGIMLTYVHFGTIEYAKLFPLVQPYLELAQHGHLDEVPWVVQTIPVLFTIGAFGKSAQIPLYVWLPDAMEGPTPVSALIHAATMVTAGVYLVARFLPMYICSGWALPMVAWGGALTALLAATIGMAQFDIKRIMAYSTVSQLGYMFAGLGVLGATGGAGHVFTHAFFKALLFLACGAVMHGFAGQLDLRKLSGLSRMKGWKVVSITMLIGCLNLAGFPFITAGFWTKDSIIGDAFASPRFEIVGWILLITAALTAYYTFRVFFRVFVGPAHFEPGDEGLGDDAHAQAEHDAKHDHQGGHRGPEPQVEETEAGAQLARAGVHQEQGHGQGHGDGFHPHPPGWAINLVLALLAVATFAAVPLVSHMLAGHDTWLSRMVGGSTAGADGPHGEHGTFLGMDAHTGAMYASIVGAILGILIAAYLHGPRGLGGLFIGSRTSAAVSRADGIRLGPLARGARHKWYVDELYHSVFVVPLRVLGHVFHAIDKLIVDGLVNLFGSAPRFMAHGARRTQTGVLHDYALRMAGGLALIVLVVWFIHSGPDMGSPEAPPPAPEAHAAIQAGVGR